MHKTIQAFLKAKESKSADFQRLLKKAGLQDKQSQMFLDELNFSAKELEGLLKITDEAELKTALRSFLDMRWRRIKKLPAAYVECPESPINQLCEELAILIAQPGEPIIKILIPTLEIDFYNVEDTLISLTEKSPEDRHIDWRKFIISHDGKAIIPFVDWFGSQDGKGNTPCVQHLYATAPGSENGLMLPEEKYEGDNYSAYCQKFKRPDLSPEDRQALATIGIGSPIESYMEQIEYRIELAGRKGLYQAVKKLIQDLRDNGVSSKKKTERIINGKLVISEATDQYPHPDVYPLILEFVKDPWNKLPSEQKKTIASLNIGSFTFESYLLRLREGAEDGNTPAALKITEAERDKVTQENLHRCVEVNANRLEEIFNAHDRIFSAGKEKPLLLLSPILDDVKTTLPEILAKKQDLFNNQRYINNYSQWQERNAAHAKILKKQKMADAKELVYYHDFLDDKCIEFFPQDEETIKSLWNEAVLTKNKAALSLLVKYQKGTPEPSLLIFCAQTESRWLEGIELLIEAKIALDAANDSGFTALHYAARRGDTEMVEKLIEAGAPVHCNSNNDCTPLYLAVYNGHTAVVEKLLEHKDIKPSITQELNYDVKQSLVKVALNQKYYHLIPMLLNKDVDFSDLKLTFEGKEISLLHWAALYNQVEIVSALLNLKNKPNLNATDPEGFTALHYAAREGHVEMVEILIEAGAFIHCKSKDNRTPLFLAVKRGHTAVVKKLLEHKNITSSITQELDDGEIQRLVTVAFNQGNYHFIPMLLNAASRYEDKILHNDQTVSLLHWAASNNHVEIVRALLKHKNQPNLDTKDSIEFTALHYAAREGNIEIVEKLIEAGATVHCTSNKGNTPLFLAVYNNRQVVVEKLLENEGIAKSINQESNGNQKQSLVKVAFDQGHYHLIPMLLDAGSRYEDCNFISSDETVSLLHWAAFNNHVEIVSALLKHKDKPDLNAKDGKGCTALHYAAREGNKEILEKLIEAGAPVHCNSNKGNTPLLAAVYFNRKVVVEKLLEHKDIASSIGQKLNDEKVQSLVKVAFDQKHYDLIPMLLNKDVDFSDLKPTLKGIEISLLHWAVLCNQVEIVSALINNKKYPPDLKFNGQDGFTALHYAARNGDIKIVEKLIAAGAPIHCNSSKNWTPLFLAVYNGHTAVVKKLLENEGIVESINQKLNGDQKQSLVKVAFDQKHYDLIPILLDAGIDFSENGESRNQSLLVWAVAGGFLEIVKRLITRGINIADGTAFSFAMANKQQEIMNVFIPDENWRGVYKAVYEGNLESLKNCSIVDADNINIKFSGLNLLTVAVNQNHLHIISYLLENGADFNMVSCIQDTVPILYLLHNNQKNPEWAPVFEKILVNITLASLEAFEPSDKKYIFFRWIEESKNMTVSELTPEMREKIKRLAFAGFKCQPGDCDPNLVTEQLKNQSIFTTLDDLLKNPDLEMLMKYYGLKNLCTLAEIDENGVDALKLYTKAEHCRLSKKAAADSPMYRAKITALDAAHKGTANAMIHALKLHHKGILNFGNAKSFNKLPEPLKALAGSLDGLKLGAEMHFV